MAQCETDHECSDGKCGGCLSCQLAQAQHTNTELYGRLGELERFRKENDILRGIASKIMPCHYCGVDSIAKCPHGFPGCSLADDMSCAEDCMAQEIIKLRKEIMQAHQERVITEKTDLDGKIERLTAFTSQETFKLIPVEEQERMTRQLGIMRQYSGVLAERIAAFPT